MARDDPYLRDPNIRSAANLVLIGWPLLLAALGSAAAGWFGFSAWLGIVGGLVVGALFSNLILRIYGRSRDALRVLARAGPRASLLAIMPACHRSPRGSAPSFPTAPLLTSTPGAGGACPSTTPRT